MNSEMRIYRHELDALIDGWKLLQARGTEAKRNEVQAFDCFRSDIRYESTNEIKTDVLFARVWYTDGSAYHVPVGIR